jgi:hypothetical protein
MLITTVGQGIQFLWLALSSRAELSAKVLFLRKQLAFYQCRWNLHVESLLSESI